MARFHEDSFRILGLSPDATTREVRMAYRRLAMQYHPDRNHGDSDAEEKFKEIQSAYETLTGKKGSHMGSKGSPAPTFVHEKTFFAEDIHPFFGFFQAMQNHFAGKKKTE